MSEFKLESDIFESKFFRVQLNCSFYCQERNDLRSLVDSCQKEVTLGGMQDPRTEALEKLVEGYRKKLEQIENEPHFLSTGDFLYWFCTHLRILQCSGPVSYILYGTW